MSGSNALKRQHAKAIRAYNLRHEGLSVKETAELLGVPREKVRVLEVLGERLLSATSISN